MAEIHSSTRRPDGHSVFPDGRLGKIERELHRTLLHLAGEDWSVTIELKPDEAQVLTAALKMLEIYPSIREVTT